MTAGPQTRRQFVSASSRTAAAGWLALQLPMLAALAGCARDEATSSEAFKHLSKSEARTMRAFAAQILPSDDDVPGAEEAGAAHFVDRAMGMPFFEDKAALIRSGLAELDARAKVFDPNGGFASLSAAQQVAIMQRIENEPFFAAARTLVVIGTLADPSYGGNRGGAGWTMMAMQHEPSYAAPFGWYDAPHAA